MSKIPEDVMKAAEAALDKVLCNCAESCGGTEGLRAASIADIAQAIMAERERCVAQALYIAADWHDKQSRQFKDMANDYPRLGELVRAKAAAASKFHSGSAASLRVAAMGEERRALNAGRETE